MSSRADSSANRYSYERGRLNRLFGRRIMDRVDRQAQSKIEDEILCDASIFGFAIQELYEINTALREAFNQICHAKTAAVGSTAAIVYYSISEEEVRICIEVNGLGSTLECLASTVARSMTGVSADKTRSIIEMWKFKESEELSLLSSD